MEINLAGDRKTKITVGNKGCAQGGVKEQVVGRWFACGVFIHHDLICSTQSRTRLSLRH